LEKKIARKEKLEEEDRIDTLGRLSFNIVFLFLSFSLSLQDGRLIKAHVIV